MRVPAMDTETQIVTAAEFKAKCLQLMDQVTDSKLSFIVTKRGKAVAQLIAPPVAQPRPFRPIFGRSPRIEIPDHEEWLQLKSDWSKDWIEPGEQLTHIDRKPKKKKGRA